MKRAPMYLHLFHGRTDPEEDMDTWGTDGPVLKIEGFHLTYGNVMHVGVPDHIGYDEWLDMDLDHETGLVYYNGVYYGDFSIFATGTDPDLEARAIDIVPEATIAPVPPEKSWNPEDQ